MTSYYVVKMLYNYSIAFFQIKELQSESDHFKSDLAEARAQYKDCAQEVMSELHLSCLQHDNFRNPCGCKTNDTD